MFEDLKLRNTHAQIAATILAGLLSNPTLTDGDKELNWGALCEDADQAARHLLERASQ